MNLGDIRFPAFALFQGVVHKGERQMQFRPNRKFRGRTIIVIPDRGSHEPIEGRRIPIEPGRILKINDHTVLLSCFVPKEHSFETKLSEAMAKLGHAPKQERRPKKPKKIHGKFVDPNAPTQTANLAVPVKGMTPELRREERRQRSLARVISHRGGAVVGTGKVGASDEKKARNAEKRKRAAAG